MQHWADRLIEAVIRGQDPSRALREDLGFSYLSWLPAVLAQARKYTDRVVGGKLPGHSSQKFSLALEPSEAREFDSFLHRQGLHQHAKGGRQLYLEYPSQDVWAEFEQGEDRLQVFIVYLKER